MSILKKVTFNQINLADTFFSSLRADYVGFDNWFQKKSQTGEQAYVFQKDGGG